MRVLVVAEFYPRAHDPVLGIWAHRQALAARDAGADVRVLVLERPIPPLSTPKSELAAETRRLLQQPRRTVLDGLDVRYVRFASPPRPGHYGRWGAWAAPALRLALRGQPRPDLVHAHNAVPAGDAVRRAAPGLPLVVSVHGGDVLHTAVKQRWGAENVRRTFEHARLVLANSAGIAERSAALGARRTEVLHLGTDVPDALGPKREHPTLVTVAHLVARKRHSDVLRSMWALRDRLPELRYLVIGDGPERPALQRLATELGVADRVEFTGQLEHAEALRRARQAHLFVMPSTDEAFGVAYVEAMAGGVPAIGSTGEPGPVEIAAAGDGIRLVGPGDVERLSAAIAEELADPRELRRRGQAARRTVEAHFTWAQCGRATVEAYERALS